MPKVTKRSTKPKRVTKKTSVKEESKPKILTIDDIDISMSSSDDELPTSKVIVLPKIEEKNEEIKEEPKMEPIVEVPKVEEKKEEPKMEPPKEESKVENETPKVEESKIGELKLSRTLVTKDTKINEKGEKTYEYHYNIVDESGKVVSQQIVVNNQKKSPNTKFDIKNDEHINTVVNAMNNYIEEMKIPKTSLYKRMNLDNHLKDMIIYLSTHHQLKITQKQLRDLINDKVLEKTK